NSFTHNTWLNDAGNVCFTTDELAEAYLYAWDVSDPGNIQQLDRIRSSLSDGNAIPHNTHVLNDYLVTSYYRDGINIVDAARPHNLIEVGYYDTSPALENGGFNGSWGAYPFLPSGLVLASDMENGLFVLQPNYVRGCYLEGNITDAMTSAPLSSVDIIINGPDVEETSMTNGSYAMGLAQAGSYTVTYSKLGYIPENRTVQLQNGVLVIEDVELQPLVRVDAMIEVVESNSLLPIGDAQVLLFDPNNDNLLEDYVTDANGQALGSEIFAVTYDVIVARWGYQTQKLQVAVDPSNPQILLQMDPGYYDDFVVDFDWFVVNDASTGIWERGEPNGTFAFNQTFNPDNDLPTDIGNRAFVTGNASGVGIGEDDVDDGFTSVQSPIMDLRDYKDPILTFHWWLVNLDVNTGGSGDDYLAI
ncbi:MAG: carboxypeptidase regulatory-like domain-containing protein, partial [Bacteroidota bacterium]